MVIALIVSGGKGVRMGSAVPKQFLLLEGIPILQRTIMKFDSMAEVDEMIIVLPESHLTYFSDLNYKPVKPAYFVAAGSERKDSVRNGLEKAAMIDPQSIVLIHDGVRPLVSEKTVTEGIRLTRLHGAAAAGVFPKDTIKVRGNDGFSEGTLDRSRHMLIHTPQCFITEKILEAHLKLSEMDKNITDDTSVYEYFHEKVYLFDDGYENIKITTAEDLLLAEQIIRSKKIL